MAQVPEIPASAYAPEMETLAVIPDIPIFEGDRISVSRNALTFDALYDCALEEQFRDAAVSEVWAYEYRIYLGEDPYHWRCYLNDRALADLFLTPWERDAWTGYAPRVRAEALTRSRVLLQGYWLDRYYLGERVLEIRTATAHRRVPVASPSHICTLDRLTPEDRLLEYGGFPADDYLEPGDYASYLSTRLKTRLTDVREYSQDRRRHQTPAFYEAQAEVGAPAGPTGVMLGDVPFPLGMEVTLDPTLGLGPTLAIPADLRQAPPELQLDPEHATHISITMNLLSQKYLPGGFFIECLSSLAGACSKVSGATPEVLLCPNLYCQIVRERHEMMENDRLHTRLKVEGIPLDFSDEEEDDDDDSSSDDDPPLPPSSVRQAAAGPSRRRR
ncbi:hypothetical protein JCGZ_07871 [Jatropha curcas]|uniref:Aminotransferase-like plant mobile domain-containing protein n=1 Tax=Jatropha curcas TaxID=180498 RepID=A0A067KNT2_JATCU|nr:hypothetical protein JCGZ_07871 [Jatropha curcas]